MNKKIGLIFVAFALITSFLNAKTIEVNDLVLVSQETENLDQDCLMIFDVDETLIVKSDAILRNNSSATEIFYEELLSLAKSKNDPKIRNLFSIITLNTEIEAIDCKSYEIINSLQAKGIPVIVLTAAVPGKYGFIPNMTEFRMKELESLGYDFSQAFPHLDFLELHKNNQEVITAFKKGVIFSGTVPKGIVLKQFFEKIQWYPKKIILVDDRKTNHDSLESVLADLGIEYVGFYYKGINNLPSDLDEAVARYQIKHLWEHEEWLSDAKAKEVMQEVMSNE